MKRLILASLLALGATAGAAYADSKPVAAAKQEIATGKAHLKAARASEHAAKKSASRAKRIAKLQAQIAKLQHDPGTKLGCGTCTDNHDGSCTCPPAKGGL